MAVEEPQGAIQTKAKESIDEHSWRMTCDVTLRRWIDAVEVVYANHGSLRSVQ